MYIQKTYTVSPTILIKDVNINFKIELSHIQKCFLMKTQKPNMISITMFGYSKKNNLEVFI